MTQQELKTRLKTAMRDADIPARPKHLELTKSLAKSAPRRFIGRERIGFARFLSMQIRFIGWKVWALQCAVLVAIGCFLAGSAGKDFMENPRFAALLLCCLSILVLTTALPFIHRSIRYKMHEIEAAARFSSVKLLMAKLLILGIGDVFMLVCIVCFALLKTPLAAGGAVLYVLFPFLLACAGLLFLLNHIPAAQFVVGSAGLCFLLLTVFALLPEVCPAFYQQTFSLGWTAICVLLVALCLIQIRQIFHRCAYTEMQLA